MGRRIWIGLAIVLVPAIALAACQTPAPTSGAPSQQAPPSEVPSPSVSPDLPRGHWIPVREAPLSGRVDYAAAWTGSAVFVWGGDEATPDLGLLSTNDGALYDPSASRWQMVAPTTLSKRSAPRAVTVGDRVLVWGGVDMATGEPLLDGAFYHPATDTWTTVADAPVNPRDARLRHAFAVDDDVVVLTAGPHGVAAARLDGAGQWTEVPTPLVVAQEIDLSTAVWTGREIIWILYPAREGPALGIAYDPANDTWRDIADTPLAAGAGTPAVWTGREVVTFGSTEEPALLGAAAYDPARDRWRALRGVDDCTTAGAVWTGAAVLSVDPPRLYDPAADRCQPLPPTPLRANGTRGHEGVTPVWTGSSVFVYSGSSGEMTGQITADAVIWRP